MYDEYPREGFVPLVKGLLLMAKAHYWIWIIATLILFAIALATMILWNWLMTSIFSLRPITFFEALGLIFLFHFLFLGNIRTSGLRSPSER